MIIRTYTDEGELINEHKISDENNYAELYDLFYVIILRKFNDRNVIKLCINLLKKVLPEPKINIDLKVKQIDPIIGEYVDKIFWDLLDKTEE